MTNLSQTAYYLIMGIVQGLTEFIPVSSSGHLVLAQNIFGIKEPQIFLNIVLHVGTLCAVIAYFWRDILEICHSLFRPKSPGFKMAMLIAVGTAPAAIFGFVLKKKFELFFASPVFSAVFFLITGTILFASKYAKTTQKNIEAFAFKDAVLIGLAQVAAIAPGISRSGTTVTAGLFRGIDRTLCVKYSLLLSIPVIAGAMLSEIGGFAGASTEDLLHLLLGFTASFMTGLFAISVLVKVLQRDKLHMFAYYCWTVGFFAILCLM